METREKTLHPGEILFHQGDPPDEVYLIKTGKIEILVGEGEREKRVALLGSGEFLGEMSIIDGRPRSATARAVDRTVVIAIDSNKLKKTLEEEPLIGALVMNLVKRIRDMDRKLRKMD